MKVAGTQLPSNLGNPYKSISVTPGSLLGLIYDGLTFVDEKGKLQPALATSWKSDGNTKWLFQIKEGVYFHNNTLNSIENIAQNINFIIQEKNRIYPISVELSSISAISNGKFLSLKQSTIQFLLSTSRKYLSFLILFVKVAMIFSPSLFGIGNSYS